MILIENVNLENAAKALNVNAHFVMAEKHGDELKMLTKF